MLGMLCGSGWFNFVAKVPSQYCFCAFSVLTSLRTLSFFFKCFYYALLVDGTECILNESIVSVKVNWNTYYYYYTSLCMHLTIGSS